MSLQHSLIINHLDIVNILFEYF